MENYLKQRAKEYLLNAYDFRTYGDLSHAKRYYAMYEAIAEVLYEFFNASLELEYSDIIKILEEL